MWKWILSMRGISTRQRLTISHRLCIFHVAGVCSQPHCFHVQKSNNRKHTLIPTLSQVWNCCYDDCASWLTTQCSSGRFMSHYFFFHLNYNNLHLKELESSRFDYLGSFVSELVLFRLYPTSKRPANYPVINWWFTPHLHSNAAEIDSSTATNLSAGSVVTGNGWMDRRGLSKTKI